MKYLVTLAAAFALCLAALPAQAGIIIVDLRDQRDGSQLSKIASRTHVFGISGYRAELDAKNATEIGGESHTAEEIKQIQAGLITEEEAASGCGGASAATGPAGLLPLLVAGGALIRRRRR